MSSDSDLKGKLQAALAPQQVTLVEEATRVAARLDVPLYLVGGAVRDLFIGRTLRDLDLVVEGDAGLLAAALAANLDGNVVARSQFGTAEVSVLGQRIDVVTARRETYRRPGALPTVQPGTIAEDISRRDFTINAIALRLLPQPPALLDPHNGKGDIASGLVRVLHPASFQDDATRILRAVHYEQRLGFRLDAETDALLRRDLAMLDTISADRLRHELDVVFKEEHAPRVLQRAAELGVLHAVHPALPDALALRTGLARLTLLAQPVQPLYYLALLAHGLGHEHANALIRRLNMPKTWATIVRDIATAQWETAHIVDGASPADVDRKLRGLSPVALQVVAALTPRDTASRQLRRYVREWRHVRPVLNGRDLARLGVVPGPRVGELLEALRYARLDGNVASRADEEAFVRERVDNERNTW